MDFFVRQHAAEAVVAAVALCFLTALIGFRSILIWRDGPPRERPLWFGLGFAALGSGVWCTHFLAMLGYRPDLALGFAIGPALASLAMAFGGVGAVMLLGAAIRRPWGDVLGGVLAAVATAAMHGVGVAGLTGCLPVPSPAASALGAALCAVFFVAALSVLRRSRAWAASGAAALFAAGVAMAHFIAVGGLTLGPAAAPAAWDLPRGALAPVIVVTAAMLVLTLALLSAVGRRSASELEKLAAVAMHTSNLVLVLDEAGAVSWANPAFLRRTGLRWEEIEGCDPLDALGGRRTGCEAVDAMRAALAAQRPEAQELMLRIVDGGVLWARAALSPVRGVDGRVTAFVLILNDVTDAKAREAAFTAARDHAERASRAKSEFMSIMSHELRTPLNAVIGFSSLLALDPLTERQRRQAETIGASARALLDVVNDILEFAADSADAGARAACDLRALAGELEREFAPLAAAKGLALSVTVDGALPALPVIDGPGLAGALRRLVENAVKFTTDGGVTVTFRPGPDAVLQRLVAEVSDTGPGVPPDLLLRLRGGFAQLDASITRRAGGVGLGLALVGRVVERMDARLFIDGAPGGGACFRIEAPVAPATAAPVAVAIAAPVAVATAAPVAVAPPVRSRSA